MPWIDVAASGIENQLAVTVGPIVLTTNDGGTNWQTIDAGEPVTQAVWSSSGELLLAGVGLSRVDETGTVSRQIGNQTSVFVDGPDGSIVATGFPALVSDDQGQSWSAFFRTSVTSST